MPIDVSTTYTGPTNAEWWDPNCNTPVGLSFGKYTRYYRGGGYRVGSMYDPAVKYWHFARTRNF
jgi:hypothetical protein